MKRFLVLCLSIAMALSLVACDWESGWEQPDWPSEYEEDVNREDPDVTNPTDDENLESDDDEDVHIPNQSVEPNEVSMIFDGIEDALYNAESISIDIKYEHTAENWTCDFDWICSTGEYSMVLNESVGKEYDHVYVVKDGEYKYFLHSPYESVYGDGYVNKTDKIITLFYKMLNMEPFYTLNDMTTTMNGVECKVLRMNTDFEYFDIYYYTFDFVLYVDVNTGKLVTMECVPEEYEQYYRFDITYNEVSSINVPEEIKSKMKDNYETMREAPLVRLGYREYNGLGMESMNLVFEEGEIRLGMTGEELFEDFRLATVGIVKNAPKKINLIGSDRIPENKCAAYLVEPKNGEKDQVWVVLKNETNDIIDKEDAVVCGYYIVKDNTKVKFGFDLTREDSVFGVMRNVLGTCYVVQESTSMPQKCAELKWIVDGAHVLYNIQDEFSSDYIFVEDAYLVDFLAKEASE